MASLSHVWLREMNCCGVILLCLLFHISNVAPGKIFRFGESL